VVVPDELQWAVYDSKEAYNAAAPPSFRPGEPLIRAAVVTGPSSDKRHFILTMHHAVYDGWSLPLLLEQAMAALQGVSLVVRPFSPFIAYLAESNAAAEAFWQCQFVDLETASFPTLPTPTYTPNATESIVYTMALRQGPTYDFTVSTKLRLAWALTISQYTNTSDVV
jgi:hypothetical protein